MFVHIETHLISVSTLLAECCARAPSESAKNIYEVHLSTYHQTEAETDGVKGRKKRNCFVYSVAGLRMRSCHLALRYLGFCCRRDCWIFIDLPLVFCLFVVIFRRKSRLLGLACVSLRRRNQLPYRITANCLRPRVAAATARARIHAHESALRPKSAANLEGRVTESNARWTRTRCGAVCGCART